MYRSRIKRLIRVAAILALATLTPASVALASNEPELPEGCSSIRNPAGSKLLFHTYAKGVQIYRWNGASWDFVSPVATLYAEENFFGEVGIHYVGPKWESKSGSKVEGRRVPGTGCAPDPSAIAWLLLSRFDSSGPGIFANVAYIQRVNTTGGLAPSEPGTLNEVREVPYTAEYYFYKAKN